MANTAANSLGDMQMRHSSTKSVRRCRRHGAVQLAAEQDLPNCQSILPKRDEGLDLRCPTRGEIRGTHGDGNE
jgi:hypothetical protein